MTEKNYKVVWSDEAKSDLKDIYNYIKNKSPQGAKSVISDIRNAPKKIHFSQQNELEHYNNAYYRIIVRNYKLLYRVYEDKGELVVYVVFDARQSPEKLIGK